MWSKLKSLKKNNQRNIRIIKRDLIYIIGLPESIAKEDELIKKKLLGQYGKIEKIVVNKDKPFNRNHQESPSFSAYITFSDEVEAALAILSIDGFEIEDKVIRASFGMTKYCSFFLRKISCPNSDCLYLHEVAKESDCYNKEENFCTKNILKVDQNGIIEHILLTNPEILENPKVSDKQNNSELLFPHIKTALIKIKNFYEINNEKIETKKIEKNPKIKKSCKKQQIPIVNKSKIKNLNLQKWDSKEENLPKLFSPLKAESSKPRIDLFKCEEIVVQVQNENEAHEVNPSNCSVENENESIQINIKTDKKNELKEEINQEDMVLMEELQNEKKTAQMKYSLFEKNLSDITYNEKKSLDNENDSTMDKKDESNKTDSENFINKKIEEILTSHSEELTKMDKMILKALKKSDLKLSRTNSRYKFANTREKNEEDYNSPSDRFLNIKNLINKFLGIDLYTKDKEIPKNNTNENFRLFDQTYTFNFQKEVYF